MLNWLSTSSLPLVDWDDDHLPALAAGQPFVHVYRLWLPAAQPWLTALRELLTPGEVDQARRQVHWADVRCRLISRAVLRLVAARYAGLLPTDLALAHTEAGQPWLPAEPGLRLSLSHADELLLLAVASQPVGIDAEWSNQPVLPEVAGRCFSAAEQAYATTPARFHQLWTRKEALGKAVGTGLTDDTAQLPVLDGRHPLPVAWFQGGQLRTFEVGGGYVGSVAWAGPAALSFHCLEHQLPLLLDRRLAYA